MRIRLTKKRFNFPLLDTILEVAEVEAENLVDALDIGWDKWAPDLHPSKKEVQFGRAALSDYNEYFELEAVDPFLELDDRKGFWLTAIRNPELMGCVNDSEVLGYVTGMAFIDGDRIEVYRGESVDIAKSAVLKKLGVTV